MKEGICRMTCQPEFQILLSTSWVTVAKLLKKSISHFLLYEMDWFSIAEKFQKSLLAKNILIRYLTKGLMQISFLLSCTAVSVSISFVIRIQEFILQGCFPLHSLNIPFLYLWMEFGFRRVPARLEILSWQHLQIA